VPKAGINSRSILIPKGVNPEEYIKNFLPSIPDETNPTDRMETGPNPDTGMMQNMGGFDARDLMSKPERVQQSTRDQAEKVSEPYREANMMAAEKTNPMNAASQEPGMSFLMKYIGK